MWPIAEDRSGSNRSLLGNVSQGVHLFAVPPDTPLMAFTHLCIFARPVGTGQNAAISAHHSSVKHPGQQTVFMVCMKINQDLQVETTSRSDIDT